EDAERAWALAVLSAPDHVGAWTNLGSVRHELGKIDEMFLAYRRALEIDPRAESARYYLARSLAERKPTWDEALQQFDVVLKAAPQHAEAHCYRGVLLLRLGRFREAISSLEQGHGLGSKRSRWRETIDSETWLADARRMAELDANLDQALKAPPAHP